MAISQIPIPSSGLTSADIAPLARTSDLSTLATSAGLITQPTWTLLGSNTSNATTFTSLSLTGIPQTYKTLKIAMPSIYLQDYQGGYANGLMMRLNNNSNTIYHGMSEKLIGNTSTSPNVTQLSTLVMGGNQQMTLTPSGDITYNLSSEIIIENYSSSTQYKNVYINCTYTNGTTPTSIKQRYLFGSTSQVTSIDLSGTQSYWMIIPNQSNYTGRGIFIYGSN